MEIDKIKELVHLVAELGVSELEITSGDEKIKILNRVAPLAAAPMIAAPVAPVAMPVAAMSPPAAVVPIEGKTIKSPMVGTFYHSASPEARPFIAVGDKVKAGQVIGIIEAMKLMNEVVSEYDGEVKEILVQNTRAVEFGQALVILV